MFNKDYIEPRLFVILVCGLIVVFIKLFNNFLGIKKKSFRLIFYLIFAVAVAINLVDLVRNKRNKEEINNIYRNLLILCLMLLSFLIFG